MSDVLFLLLWFMSPLEAVPALPVHTEGYVTAYAPGLMQQVMARRIREYDQLHPWYGHVPKCLCALNDNHIDQYVLIFPEDHPRVLCYVVDVATPHHVKAREEKNYVIEVDWWTFQDIGPGRVVVSLLERRD